MPSSNMRRLWSPKGKAREEGIDVTAADPSNLVGYCGLYCNACGIRQEKIKTAVNNLRDIIAHYGFDKMMSEFVQWEPSFKHYNEFDEVMDGLVQLFGDCPGCLQGGGDPNCKVRSCAKQKGYRTCAECNEAGGCEPLAPYRKGYKGLTPALQCIRENGIRSYAEGMQKKVDNGYSYVDESK
ncbi:MAG: DUF3795 domain-containing protein [Candidatus Bathyarchaeota archaeon]|nr:MAG: DUF3795 domain-containing protein [Candidatus Bathyarchaeota archaeon]